MNDEIERLHDHQEFKRAVLEARIDEHSLWKPVAEEIVAKDGVYRGVNFLNARASQLTELKHELEKL